MKLYIKSNQQPVIHLRDVVDTVELVVVVDDINTYRMDHILGSEDIDYTDYTDDELLAISEDEMAEIFDVNTLVRILQLDPDRLMDYQCKIIDDADIHIEIDDTDIVFLLNQIKQCSDFRIEPKNRNKAFARIHNLTDEDIKTLIRSLTMDDFVKKIWGVYGDHKGSQLLVFQPRRPMTDKHGTPVPDFEIYVKVDKTQSVADGTAIIVISLHATRGEAKRQKKRDSQN